MRDFALHTLKKFDMNIGYVDLRDTTKNLPSEKKLNRSQNKEHHKLLKIDNSNYLNNLKQLVYCDTIYDYSEKFGLLYKMTKDNLIGAVYNDKSILFKYMGKSIVYYLNRKKNILTPKAFDKKNIVTEIKQKYEILINFEKYLNSQNNEKDKIIGQNSSNQNVANAIYVKKIIKSDKAIMMKFSNKIIQLTFKDDTKLIIDNEKTQTVYFFDKNNKKHHYSIHLVNKSTNKRFINRYEHYKKIFFEKMDERFKKIQEKRELENEGKNNDNQEEENEEIEQQEEFPKHPISQEMNKTT